MDQKKQIFIPELFIYDLLKFESPEVLMKSEGITITANSLLRFDLFTNQSPFLLIRLLMLQINIELFHWLL